MKKGLQKLLTLMLFLALFAAIIPVHQPVSATDAAQWTPVNIPAEGNAGKWTLANGSDLRYLTLANDGTLYCYANPSGTTYTLFKSKDGGRSWTTTGKVTDVIIDIAALPQDGTNIYYATTSRIYKSVDAGSTFIPLPLNPGGAGSGNVVITSIDVVRAGDANTVVVSTIDTDTSQYGGVYLLDESQSGSAWVNTNIGNYDVYRVVFSPDYANDRQIIAAASDEVDTCTRVKINTLNWGQMIGNARIRGIVPSAANIAFPDEYNGMSDNATFFLGIDTAVNSGDVYKITGAPAPAPSTAKDLKVALIDSLSAVDIASLAISGNTILAGCARNARVYLSNDSGENWTQSTKSPTGQTDSCILTAPDFTNQHKAYAVTRGIESAFSFSSDGGQTWNQLSLVDSKITSILDIATPLTTTVFMLTFDGENLKHSLWRTTDSGSTWDRIFCGSFTGIDNLKLFKTIPQYSADSPVIFIAGQMGSIPVIWKSNDNGQHFVMNAVPCSIDTWTIIDGNTWFISGYNGGKGLVYRTNNGGNFYSIPAETGSLALIDLLSSPDYTQDKTVLAGNSVGQIYLSQDNGTNFSLLGQTLPLTASIGRICLAFDSKFSENKIVYAATDAKVVSTGKDRIFRFTIGQSTTWQSIDGSLPDNACIRQVTVTSNGTLYAVNTQPTEAATVKGGVVRSLNPTSSSPAFETLLSGLEDTIVLNKLSFYGNQLWVVDNKNTRLMTFVDSLTQPMILVSPENKASGLDTTSLNLKWQAMNGATKYEWQVSDNTSFTGILSGLTGTSDSCTARLTGLEPATTYYWRVRTSTPCLSRWSDTWSFSTVLGGSNVVPLLSVPAAGAKTAVKPVFQWSTIVSADRYDLLVAKDAAFSDIIIDKTGDNALHSNAWESDIFLENGTTYYWKVRARSEISIGTWSAVSVFLTEFAAVTSTSTDKALVTSDPPSQKTQTQTQTQIQTPTPTTSVSIAQLPATSPAVNVNVNVNIPPWIIFCGIALLAIIVLALVMLTVTTIRRHH
jgi:photosystem II stability/assembly factor-like uncharacterized protein